ncbi:uncharacterized protein MONBRDRAFT_24755 [Monosiga brevicollis MX1]|uniref:Kinesin motor domain-containing protein n=1 Tax=Monosiga brevicollis TaxID=81824 RepID=A9UXD7_MONBE|nr:uncharacterized protein MONBRDRAFT_24755 [Monosiga brevicollis MX1]EDQ90372.1 predicted protein [Monosiga brevicollis MX1]|eukprot:XP_001745139.1 hypothetical protein [Monosiga brevicollis MX1]
MYSPTQDAGLPANHNAAEVDDIRTRLFASTDEDDADNVPAQDSAPQQSVIAPAPDAARVNALMQVFARLKPPSNEHSADQSIQRLDDQTLMATPPPSSVAYKNANGSVSSAQYSFSHVFDTTAQQRSFFKSVGLPMVKEVLDGNNGLLFATGVTSSGKTYTVLGSPESPGLLPRSLDVLFNSIGQQLCERNDMKPQLYNKIRFMTREEVAEAATIKAQCLDLGFQAEADAVLDATAAPTDTDANEELQQSTVSSNTSMEDMAMLRGDREVETTTLGVHDGCQYLIYVSFAELYNELAYDLLEPVSGKHRSSKKLRGSNGAVYIDGLREVQVASIEEALRVFTFGRHNRRVASTRLNKDSSRSHSIFTLKVIRLPNVAEPHYASISRLSIVDLAGSERTSNTQAGGKRIREAGNINKSLMTLSQCIKDLRWNQLHPRAASRLPPFRESRLTRLFQGYLEGKGVVRMIVNLSVEDKDYDETIHVLNFSAIARKVKDRAVASRIDTGRHAASTSDEPQNKMVLEGELSALRHQLDATEKDMESLHEYNETLQDRIYDLQQALLRFEREQTELEARIREEVAEEMAEQLVEIEEAFEAMAKRNVTNMEHTYERKLALLTHSVARAAHHRRIRSAVASPAAPPQAAVANNAATAPSEDEVRLGTELRLAQERIAELEQQLGAAQQENENTRRDLKSVRARAAEEVGAITVKYKRAQVALEQAQIQAVGSRDSLQKETADLQSKLEAANAARADMLTLVAELEADLEARETENAQLQAQVEQLFEAGADAADVAQLHEQAEIQAATISELRAQVASVQELKEMTTVQAANIAALEREVKVIKAKNKALQEEVKALQQDKATLRQKLDDVTETAQSAMEEAEQLSRASSMRSLASFKSGASIKSTISLAALEHEGLHSIDNYVATPPRVTVSVEEHATPIYDNMGEVTMIGETGARDSPQSSKRAKRYEVHADAETADPVEAAQPSALAKASTTPEAKTRKGRKGRKAAKAVKETAEASSAQDENDSVKSTPEVATKSTRRTRKLGQRTNIASPLQETSNVAATTNTKTAAPERETKMLTPIGRRLRPRRTRANK